MNALKDSDSRATETLACRDRSLDPGIMKRALSLRNHAYHYRRSSQLHLSSASLDPHPHRFLTLPLRTRSISVSLEQVIMTSSSFASSPHGPLSSDSIPPPSPSDVRFFVFFLLLLYVSPSFFA